MGTRIDEPSPQTTNFDYSSKLCKMITINLLAVATFPINLLATGNVTQISYHVVSKGMKRG
jgi:hypothetical protein